MMFPRLFMALWQWVARRLKVDPPWQWNAPQSMSTQPRALAAPSLSRQGSEISTVKSSSIAHDGRFRIFALLIGIDKYQNEEVPNLGGCVHDCHSILDFLEVSLNVPRNDIVMLTNEVATRQAILSSFENHFLRNNQIKRGDAMLFYYAGHGSCVGAPPSWLAANDQIDTICSYDVRMKDGAGALVHDIPDRTIDGLMRKLAFHKGDNITAIFDSCHSGGISRTSSTRRFLPPSSSTSPLPDHLDRDIWAWGLSTRTAQIVLPPGFLYKAMSSHVLLAACRQEEAALEAVSTKNEPCGAFTNSLVQVLRDCNLGETTYAQLADRLQVLPYQHPQCEGTNKDRVLFNASKGKGPSPTTFKVFEKDGKYHVAAGSINGVVIGTEFALSSPARLKNTILIATAVEAFHCIATCVPHVTLEDGRAKVLRWNDSRLRVYFHRPSGERFTPVSEADNADVAVLYNGRNGLLLERLDPLTRRHATPVLPTKYETISEVLDAISTFNAHLYRGNQSHPLNGLVTVRLQRLEKQESNEFLPVYLPKGNDLLAYDPEPVTSNASGSFEIPNVKEAVISDLEGFYGLTLENHSQYNLFPYVFYLDPSDYSIQPWYLPPSATMLPPLQKRKIGRGPSKLPVGYGASGTDVIQFSLPSDTRADSGFLKVFMSTSYVDMGHLAQGSPFELSRSDKRPRSSLSLNETWDAWTFVLTAVDPSVSILPR